MGGVCCLLPGIAREVKELQRITTYNKSNKERSLAFMVFTNGFLENGDGSFSRVDAGMRNA
jgi:hypothetical protein